MAAAWQEAKTNPLNEIVGWWAEPGGGLSLVGVLACCHAAVTRNYHSPSTPGSVLLFDVRCFPNWRGSVRTAVFAQDKNHTQTWPRRLTWGAHRRMVLLGAHIPTPAYVIHIRTPLYAVPTGCVSSVKISFSAFFLFFSFGSVNHQQHKQQREQQRKQAGRLGKTTGGYLWKVNRQWRQQGFRDRYQKCGRNSVG